MKITPLKLAATMALLVTPALAAAADYPQRPISLIVPFAAGGPTDVVARSLANEMGKVLKQTVVVENRTGAGGTLAAGYVAAAKPDGYTIFLHHTGMATAPAMYSKLRYDPLKSFEYIGEVVDVPMTLMARADLPPNNFKEFVDYAKANGDKINLANAGPGAVSQLCGSLLQQAMGVKFTTVPFQGTGPAMTALMGKQVDVLCDQTTQTLPHIKAKDLKFYGVTTPERITQLPDAPTLAEQGLKGFDVKVWHGLYAPKGTPEQAVDKLNESLKVALKAPAFVQRMDQLGAQIVSEERQTPESLHKWLAAEVAKWGPILKAENISIN